MNRRIRVASRVAAAVVQTGARVATRRALLWTTTYDDLVVYEGLDRGAAVRAARQSADPARTIIEAGPEDDSSRRVWDSTKHPGGPGPAGPELGFGPEDSRGPDQRYVEHQLPDAALPEAMDNPGPGWSQQLSRVDLAEPLEGPFNRPAALRVAARDVLRRVAATDVVGGVVGGVGLRVAGPDRLPALQVKYPQIAGEIARLATGDPTGKQYKYLDWMVKRFLSAAALLEQQQKPMNAGDVIEQLVQAVRGFHTVQRQLGKPPFQEYPSDINRYSLESLQALLSNQAAMRVTAAKHRYRQYPDAEAVIDQLAKTDPTGQQEYLDWAVLQALTAPALRDARVGDRVFLVGRALELLEDAVPAVGGPNGSVALQLKTDPREYKTFADLQAALDQPEVMRAVAKSEVVYDESGVRVTALYNRQAVAATGNTNWCVARQWQKHFDNYTRGNGWKFFLVERDNETFLVHASGQGVSEIKDSADQDVSESEFPVSEFVDATGLDIGLGVFAEDEADVRIVTEPRVLIVPQLQTLQSGDRGYDLRSAEDVVVFENQAALEGYLDDGVLGRGYTVLLLRGMDEDEFGEWENNPHSIGGFMRNEPNGWSIEQDVGPVTNDLYLTVLRSGAYNGTAVYASMAPPSIADGSSIARLIRTYGADILSARGVGIHIAQPGVVDIEFGDESEVEWSSQPEKVATYDVDPAAAQATTTLHFLVAGAPAMYPPKVTVADDPQKLNARVQEFQAIDPRVAVYSVTVADAEWFDRFVQSGATLDGQSDASKVWARVYGRTPKEALSVSRFPVPRAVGYVLANVLANDVTPGATFTAAEFRVIDDLREAHARADSVADVGGRPVTVYRIEYAGQPGRAVHTWAPFSYTVSSETADGLYFDVRPVYTAGESGQLRLAPKTPQQEMFRPEPLRPRIQGPFWLITRHELERTPVGSRLVLASGHEWSKVGPDSWSAVVVPLSQGPQWQVPSMTQMTLSSEAVHAWLRGKGYETGQIVSPTAPEPKAESDALLTPGHARELMGLADYNLPVGTRVTDAQNRVLQKVDEKTWRRDDALLGRDDTLIDEERLWDIYKLTGYEPPSQQRLFAMSRRVSAKQIARGSCSSVTWLRPLLRVAQRVTPQRLVHYSTTRGLNRIDPTFIGSGQLSFRERQDVRIPVSYYYFEGTEPETLLLSTAKARYESELPVGAKLLDLASRPQWVADAYRADGRGGMYRALKEAGFFGFYDSDGALPNATAIFYPLPVTETEFMPDRQRVATIRWQGAAADDNQVEDLMLAHFEREIAQDGADDGSADGSTGASGDSSVGSGTDNDLDVHASLGRV